MADALPPNSDPDFPDQPELAAALHEQLNRLFAALPADFWDVLRPMTRLARLLHRQLWLLPPSGLLRELTELTGLGKAQARRLIDLADKRAYLRELVLRGPALFSYIVVARHLLDGPLGTYTLEAALADPGAPPPPPAEVERLRADYGQLLAHWQRNLGELLAGQSEDFAAHLADLHLLDLQVAGLLRRAADEPGVFLQLIAPDDHSWPGPPPPPADPLALDFELDFAPRTLLRLGLTYVLFTVFQGASAWAGRLRVETEQAGLATLTQVLQALEPADTSQLLHMRLSLTTAADLHLAAQLSIALAGSPVWDELQQTYRLFPDGTEARGATEPPADDPAPDLVASLLPPGISLPSPEPRPLQVSEFQTLLAQTVIGPLEAHFGPDAPPLAANRALAARLAGDDESA